MARVSFNYDVVKDSKIAKQARENARQIRQLLEKSAESVIQIGRLMATVKQGLTPAVFQAWVECEFGWVRSVAWNYMQAANVFGELDCLKQFQATAIINLARKNVPEPVVTKAIELARAGEIITMSAVNRMIGESGHQPTRPDAGKARKPASLRSIAQTETVSIEQLTTSLDDLTRAIKSMDIDQQQRDALAAKFFELSMLLRMPAPPKAPKAKAPKAAPDSAKAPEAVKPPAKAKAKRTELVLA